MKNLTQSYEKHREFSKQCTEEEQAMHEGEKSQNYDERFLELWRTYQSAWAEGESLLG